MSQAIASTTCLFVCQKTRLTSIMVELKIASPQMKLYYTPLTASVFQSKVFNADPIIENIESFLDPSTRKSRQSELLHEIEHEGSYEIHWVVFRLSSASRLVGAVVKDGEHGTHSFFALELTESHDYQKTLAENPQRQRNWRQYMLAFLQADCAMKKDARLEASGEPCLQRLFQHDRRFQVASPAQAELFDVPLHQGIVCYAPPGAGKTLLAVQRGMAYFQQEKRPLVLVPEPRLAQAMRQEFMDQGVDGREVFSAVLSFNDFLMAMDDMLPQENSWHYCKGGDCRRYVNFTYFKEWCLGRRGSKSLLESELMTRWQELLYVIIRPNLAEPTTLYLSKESYEGLGKYQANFPEEERTCLYQDVFHPFLNHIEDRGSFYFFPYVAFDLVQALLRDPSLLSNPKIACYDALVLDEMQRFHPWELACLFKFFQKPLLLGQFFICGDVHQGAEIQQTRVAESFRHYFDHIRVVYYIYHLSVNYRNAQAISRFVAQIRAVELHFLGAMERETHVDMGINQQGAPGRVWMSTRDAIHINEDAQAYVIIPDDIWRERANTYWNEGQVVTLKEFAGLSAKKLVMFGFSEHFQESLKVIHDDFPDPRSFPKWDEPQPFSRRSRTIDAGMRMCFQSIFTAASRAIDELILVEMPGKKHHPLFLVMMEHAEIFESLKPSETAIPSSPKEWFDRAENDFKRGLVDNAKKVFQDERLWIRKDIAAMAVMMGESSLTESFFSSARDLLFPREISSHVGGGGGSGGSSSVEPERKRYSESKMPTPMPRSPELSAIGSVLENIYKDNFSETSLVKGISEAKSIDPKFGLKELLIERPINGDCLLVHLVYANKGENLLGRLKAHLREVKEAYDALTEPNICLQLCWRELVALDPGLGKSKHGSKKLSSLQDRISKICADTKLSAEFLSTEMGCLLLVRYDKYFSLSPKFLKALYSKIDSKGVAQGISPFYLLSTFEERKGFIFKHWNKLKAHPLFATSMYSVVTGEGRDQGESPFSWLSGSLKGQELIFKHWDELRTHPMLATSMHTVVTGEGAGADQGTSPFFWLTGSGEGRKLIIEYWDDFRAHPMLATSMHTVVTGEGENQGESPFFWFARSNEGRKLILERWGELKAHPMLATSMHTVVTGEGANQGTSPFYFLAMSEEGRQFIFEHWDDFRAHPLFATSIHTVVTGEGENQGASPFCWLAMLEEGRQFIFEHWDDFRVHPMLATSMHTVVTGEGAEQGTSPFYWLAISKKGREFLISRWEDFTPLFRLPTSLMDRIITIEGVFKGLTYSQIIQELECEQRIFAAEHAMETSTPSL